MFRPDLEENQHITERPKKLGDALKTVLCPLARFTGATSPAFGRCIKEECAVYVKLHKQTVNPDVDLVFEGCGLILAIPWRPIKREEK
jgi:hypothetical protein